MITNLTPLQRKEAFFKLGTWLIDRDDELNELIGLSPNYNAWFTPEFTSKAIESIAGMLTSADMNEWISTGLPTPENEFEPRRIGLILAGNIPLVGFPDILSVLASGHIALIKLSSQDKVLIPRILNRLIEIEPGFQSQIEYADILKGFDAVIATGSNNSSRYFDHYFSKVPHIIRKSRNSVAILNGEETREELSDLGKDIFDYYGLGCRNVSKVYVPAGYVFDRFFESIEDFKTVADHHKYNNNYDYNKSIFLVNLDKHLDNGFLLLKENTALASPLAVLYYEEYTDINDLRKQLAEQSELIQCVVSGDLAIEGAIGFGKTQSPGLYDYADGVNTMEFLKTVSRAK